MLFRENLEKPTGDPRLVLAQLLLVPDNGRAVDISELGLSVSGRNLLMV